MLSWLLKALNRGPKKAVKAPVKSERALHRLQTTCLRQVVEHEQRAAPTRRREYEEAIN